MSDAQDPLQDSLERLLHKPVYRPAEKKILFGERKPTEDAAAALLGVPLIIEAPFPYERTFCWRPGLRVPDTSEQPEAPSESYDRTTDTADRVESEGLVGEKTPSLSQLELDEYEYTAVVVSQEVLLKVNEHVLHSLDCELGGFLLGNRYRCPNTPRDYVIIDQFSPARFVESTEVNLAFTHEAWAQLADELSGKFLGKLLIGWYHSHPRMDVFLSNHDLEIQTERFPEPWMVALVLEPEKHRGGFFCARDGQVKPNSPVEFFELLERNTRESVVAWQNYTGVDPATRSTPAVGANNTAKPFSGFPVETLGSRSRKDERLAKRKRRSRRLLVTITIALLLLAGLFFAGRRYPALRQRLRLFAHLR